MGVKRVGLALVLAAGLTGCGAENQAQTAGQIVKGGSDETGEYIAARELVEAGPGPQRPGRLRGWRPWWPRWWQRPGEYRPVLGVGRGLGRSGRQPEPDHRRGVG